MSGIAFVGVALAIPGVAQQLIKCSLDGYKLFQEIKEVGEGLREHQCNLGVVGIRFQDWSVKFKLYESTGLLDAGSQRYKLILERLATIASTFAKVDRLEKAYGMVRENPPLLVGAARSEVDSRPLPTERPSGWRLTLPRPSWTRSGSKSGSRDRQPAPLRTPDFSGTEVEHTRPHTGVGAIGMAGHAESELSAPVAITDEWIREMKMAAQEYQSELSTHQRYRWAICDREKLKGLVDNLKRYTDDLDALIASFSHSLSLPNPQIIGLRRAVLR